jgi:hypothetical protein
MIKRTSTLQGKGIRGAALMLSLWALFLLSAMVISWAVDIGSRLTLSGNANRLLDAEAMACSGAEVALHPAVKPGSPNLIGGLGRGKTYEYKLARGGRRPRSAGNFAKIPGEQRDRSK